MPGVLITLYDQDDVVIATTTTDNLGAYEFSNLPPADYYLGITPPTGYIITPNDQGSDDAIDNDFDPATGETVLTTLSSGETDHTWDGGIYIAPASIGNFVWDDLNLNGIQDGGELGISGVSVQLYDSDDTLIASMNTDTNGFYGFTNLPPGDYYLHVNPPVDYAVSDQDQGVDDASDSDFDPATGNTIITTLSTGENDLDWDAGIYQLTQDASIGDRVWHDLDADGIQDIAEPAVANVLVQLYDRDGLLLDSTTTDPNGLYRFDNLNPGFYYLEFTPPIGMALTLQDQGADDSLDSDADSATGLTAVTVLTAGEHDPTWDAGLLIPPVDPLLAALGDTVWLDADGDGLQDPGELGVANVTVELYNSGGVLQDTTTTAADGLYQFSDLRPGDYYVNFDLPSGYTFSPQDQGTDDTRDSDADPSTGDTAVTTLSADENDPSWDAGLVPVQDPALAGIGDTVWQDLDADGIQDSGEPGVTNVTVELLDGGGNVLATTLTDADGQYQFSDLTPGDYAVRFTLPTGYEFTLTNQGADAGLDSDADQTSGETAVTTLAAGENDPSWDAGLVAINITPNLAQLGDTVWRDLDQDGLQDPGEPGVANVFVNLFDSSDNLVGSTITDLNGHYTFTDLTPGDYYVGFVPPANMTFTAANQGADDTIDSDADLISGQSSTTTLSAGENDPTWDAGLILDEQAPLLASLGDFVWLDQDGDGLQDVSEPGIANVTVQLYNGSGALMAITTTDADGLYTFNNLTPGDYSVTFILPAGYDFTGQDLGDDALDSDANPATGATIITNLVAGENDTSWDAGMTIPTDPALAAIGDYVWEDLNADGQQNIGEPGVAGVIVNLHDNNGNIVATTVTDWNGNYQFTDLQPEDYSLSFVPPLGMTFTTQDQGGDDAADSDVDPSDGSTIVTSLAAGENDPSWDAGLVFFAQNPALASLGNYVWEDLDSDGLQDFGEPGIGNVTIQLFDSNNVLTATTTTDANGFYSFNDLAPGDYNVTFLLPTGYSFTHDNVGADDARDSDADLVTGSTTVTTLTAGENDLTWDAGLYQQLHLGNRVWEDLNDNGRLDNGEVGIGNVLVELQDAAGNPVLDPVTGLAITTVTDSDGYYLFTNLPNGSYIVHIPASNFDEWTDPLYGFVSSQNQVGPEPATDPDDDVDLHDDGRNHEDPRMAGISSLPVTLAAGSEPLNEPEEGLDDADGNLTVDFGFFELLTLGNHVWFDTNNNGLMENNQPGVPAGVTLHLLDGNSNPVTHPVTGQPIITTTDNNGFYQFTNLYPGDYRVLIAPENFQVGGLPEGFESSDGSVDPDDDVDA